MKWAYGACLAAGALGMAVLKAPAAWLGIALPAPFELQQPSGTLWSGRALLVAQKPLCAISWQLARLSLSSAAVELQLHAPCAGAARLELQLDRIDLAHLRASLPAPVLAGLLPALQAWQPGGELQVQSERLQLTPHTQGHAQLTWHAAHLAGLPLAVLGDYQAQTQLDGPQLRGQLATLNGPLNLEGSFTLGPTPRADLHASSPQPQVENWLRTLGTAEGNSRYHLRMP